MNRIKSTIYNIGICSVWTIMACSIPDAHSQMLDIEGYTFESDNRGYLSQVEVAVIDPIDTTIIDRILSDSEGHFEMTVPQGDVVLKVSKSLFHDQYLKSGDAETIEGNKYFYKVTMHRKPGYMLDITLAEKRDSGQAQVDAIMDSYIEVYNNTNEDLEYSDKSHRDPNFIYTITKDHHYTIMIRKEGFLAKRIEAYVDVVGCILCMEGLKRMEPGVSDNLTEGHEMGTLLANVEMERVDVGSTFEIENLYYETSKYKLTGEQKEDLRVVVRMLRDNPLLEIEIGSHTDSRGDDKLNLKLSQERANAVVEYLASAGVAVDRLTARGFGDTRLVNHCREGVECSEVEHSENRRTELRVTNIREDAFADKTLEEIKHIERTEALIREVGEDEQIQLKPGEEVPEHLKGNID